MRARGLAIPLAADGAGRPLAWVIGVMVFLAALALSGAFALHGALAGWRAAGAGTLTVELPSTAGAGDGGLAAALEAAAAVPGVTAARALGPAEVAKLVEPWLGPGVAADELPLPRLIALTVAPERIDRTALAAALKRAAPQAVLDDHRLWLAGLVRLARAGEALALAIVALIGAAAAAIVAVTTRAGLAAERDTVELLHLLGARDRTIAGRFQARALRLGAVGGAGGLLAAFAALIALHVAAAGAAQLGLAPAFELRLLPWQWSALLLAPAAAAAIAMLAARLTVLGALARQP